MANCVKCGADISPGTLKCEYCGGTVDVPKTVELIAAGTRAGNLDARQSVMTGSAPKFKRVSIGLMAVLIFVTFGLYVSAWYFVRRRKFSELSPKGKKAGAIFGALLAVHIIYLLVVLGRFGGDNPAETADVLSIMWYCFMGMAAYAAIFARSCLAELAKNAQGSAPQSFSDSGYADSIIWTVILNCLCLQSQINRMIDARVLNAEV